MICISIQRFLTSSFITLKTLARSQRFFAEIEQLSDTQFACRKLWKKTTMLNCLCFKSIVLITITREHAAIPVLNKPLLIILVSFQPPFSPRNFFLIDWMVNNHFMNAPQFSNCELLKVSQ